jgi:hypothetical protein
VHREAADNYVQVAADLEDVVAASISALAGQGSDTVAFDARISRRPDRRSR